MIILTVYLISVVVTSSAVLYAMRLDVINNNVSWTVGELIKYMCCCALPFINLFLLATAIDVLVKQCKFFNKDITHLFKK